MFLHEEIMGIKGNRHPSIIGLENWSLGCWEKIIILKLTIVSLKVNIFRKPRILVVSSSQWQMSVISIFWVIWGKAVDSWSNWFGEKREGAATVTHKKDWTVFKEGFYWQVFIPD